MPGPPCLGLLIGRIDLRLNRNPTDLRIRIGPQTLLNPIVSIRGKLLGFRDRMTEWYQVLYSRLKTEINEPQFRKSEKFSSLLYGTQHSGKDQPDGPSQQGNQTECAIKLVETYIYILSQDFLAIPL